MVPDMPPLQEQRIRCCVDFIEIAIDCRSTSNIAHVRGLLANALSLTADQDAPAVFGLTNDGEHAGNGPAKHFTFKLQNPRSFRDISNLLRQLEQPGGGWKGLEISSVTFPSVEIALDTYIEGADQMVLARVLLDRYRFLAAETGDAWHCYRKPQEGSLEIYQARTWIGQANLEREQRNISSARQFVNAMAEGWQCADINKRESWDVRFHGYVKTHDLNHSLEMPNWCARMEITFRGGAVPFRTMEALAEFNFKELTQWFSYKMFSAKAEKIRYHGLQQHSVDSLARPGKYHRPNTQLPGSYHMEKPANRFRQTLTADAGLNAKIARALKILTTNWRL